MPQGALGEFSGTISRYYVKLCYKLTPLPSTPVIYCEQPEQANRHYQRRLLNCFLPGIRRAKRDDPERNVRNPQETPGIRD